MGLEDPPNAQLVGLWSPSGAAATAGGEGEIVFYGFDTATEGIAYRVRAKGAALGFENVSRDGLLSGSDVG